MKRRSATVGCTTALCCWAVFSAPAAAEPAGASLEPPTDAIRYQARVDVVAQLFRRQTFPDASGALVAGDVAIPLYHYALLRVDDVDAPWRADSLDVELAAWGNLELVDAGSGRVDGDVHVANVRHRFDHGYVRFGRQVRAGGAARYAHFDGASAGAQTSLEHVEMGVEGYGGFTVLPRWNARPGYQQLGSAADSLLRDPAALAAPAREESWLTGGRMYVTYPNEVVAGASIHEQRADGGLDRRNAAVDLQITPLEEIAWNVQAILDMDADQLADVRAGLDVFPTRELSFRAGYQHLSPALLLSRQSVLSVFSTEAFDEWGLEGDLRIARWLRLSGLGYGLRFDDGTFGARAGGTVRVLQAGPLPATASAGYRRVSESLNGYHALRANVTVSPISALSLVADGFLYLYDEPIENLSVSIVGVLSAAHRFNDHVEVMLASSLSRSPYALIDAQGTARVSVSLDGGRR